MSDLSFEPAFHPPEENGPCQPAPSSLTGLLMRTGLVRTPRQAEYALIVLAALCILVSLYLAYRSLGPRSLTQADIDRIILLQQQR